MNIRPYTDNEWNTLPHVILTSDDECDPTILDHHIDDDDAENDDWYDAISDISTRYNESLFDSTGEYKHRNIVHGIDINNHNLENGILPNNSIFYDVHEHDSYNTHKSNTADTHMNTQPLEILPNEPDHKTFIPHFAGQSIETIKKTFNATTQYVRTPMSTHLTRHFVPHSLHST